MKASMDWDNIRVFLHVARAGQFLAAARQLRVDHGTVSRKISALESALGIRLFDRHTTGCVLTGAGERLLASAEIVEAELLHAQMLISQLDADISGNLRIGMPDCFAAYFMSGRLGRLKASHPAVTVQLVPVSRNLSLPKREVDLAVTFERPKEGRLAVRKLLDYSLHFYASSAYLTEHGTPASPDELRSHQNVTYIYELLAADQLNFVQELYAADYSRIECLTATDQIAAVRGGAGIGILPDYAAAIDPHLGMVLPELGFERSYWLVTHADACDLRRVRAVSDFIFTECKTQQWLFHA
jgi:DNA-binding transcriptional LysR family regulator